MVAAGQNHLVPWLIEPCLGYYFADRAQLASVNVRPSGCSSASPTLCLLQIYTNQLQPSSSTSRTRV